jgi:PhoPQ-activated pathogenicity-related protein
MRLKMSSLPKTWIIDLDGTVFLHNGYLLGKDILLPGVKNFFDNIPSSDKIILITARNESFREFTERSLIGYGIRYDLLIMNLPVGERILINDKKPKGLRTAYAVNLTRNKGLSDISISYLDNIYKDDFHE